MAYLKKLSLENLEIKKKCFEWQNYFEIEVYSSETLRTYSEIWYIEHVFEMEFVWITSQIWLASLRK